MDSNDSIKLMMQFLIGILIFVSLIAIYMKFKPKEVIMQGNEEQLQLVN
jgi:hypothetical protein